MMGQEDADRDERIFRRGMEQGGLGLNTLHTANVARAQRWHTGFPEADSWTGGDWGNAMAGECGEACNIIKKLRRIETSKWDKDPQEESVLLVELGRELADMIIYADLVAAKYGIDLSANIVSKFNEISERAGYPERL